MATGFTVDSGITNPMLLSQIAGRGMNLFPMLQETSPLKSIQGYTPLYHGTTYAPEIMKEGFTTSKVFASPDYNEALKYAKKGPLSGTKYGAVTGDVLRTNVPTAQLKGLVKRGLTGGQEVVLNPQEATKIFQQGTGNIKGSGSLLSRFGAKALPILRSGGRFVNRFPQAATVSDMLFGTDYTASSVRDINKLLGVPLKEDGTVQTNIKDYRASQKSNVNQSSGQAATAGGAAGSGTGQQPQRRRRQPGTQQQERKRKQRSRSRAAQRGKLSKRQQRSRSRGAQRGARRSRSRSRRRYADGGIVSLNHLTRSL
jgi:hypothetical protein